MRFLVDFGSVRFGVWNILHWYLLFFRRQKSKYRLLPARGFVASRKRFHEQRLSKSGESWTRKTKASWNCQCMQFIIKKPIFAFFIELKKQLQLFQSVYWGRVRRFRFLRFGFAHGSSGSRFLRFIGYLFFTVRFHGSGSFQNLTAIVHDAKYIYIYIQHISVSHHEPNLRNPTAL